MGNWIDLTVLLDADYLPFPGEASMDIRTDKTLDRDGYNLKKIFTSMHMGTHIDAIKHVFNDGEEILDIDINTVIGKAKVIKPKIVRNVIVTNSIIKQYDGDEKILILNTGHSELFNTVEYYKQPKFTKDIIDFLVENEIEVFAFDIPSPEYSDGDFLDMHKDLLGNGILIIENLTNLDLLSDEIDFIGLPLKIKGLDGSMLRCVGKNR